MLNDENLNDHFDIVETVFDQDQNKRKVRNDKMLNGEHTLVKDVLESRFQNRNKRTCS